MPEMMDKMAIAFPNLGIYLKYVPKSFDIAGFTIALYGCIIATGILCGVLLAANEAKRTGQNPDLYWDFALYAVVISIICARIYYVVFSWDLYKDNIMSVFNLRAGGLAIYGGVIGAFGTAFAYCVWKKLSFRKLCDTAIVGLVLGQVIGRWGNFTNREAFGQYTDSLFAMRLPLEMVRSSDISQSISEHIAEGTNYIQVHPTFLYESAWNLCLLLILLIYQKKKSFEGETALLYLGGYGLGRFLIEGLRTDQLLIPGTSFAVSQVLAALLFVFAVVIDILVRIRKKSISGKA